MKILNIYFKNINSLEGENRINFEQPPFSDTGVFAITGPNGSGKSSILDAITLALYGETFRFNRPSEHVMTQNTDDCFSVLEFSLGTEKYQSSWYAQRSKTHVSTQMRLIHTLSDQKNTIANTQQQVCACISDITGMNFRNFTRSVLLAQGDFAAFLNALDNERMDILEKIISTDMYADYKNGLSAKIETAQTQLLHLQQDLAAIPLLPPEKRNAIADDLADFNDQYAELYNTQETLKQQRLTLEKVIETQQYIVEQEKELQFLTSQAASLQGKVEQLSHVPVALPLKDDITALQEKQHDLQHSRTALTHLNNELKLLQDELANANDTPESVIQIGRKSFFEQMQAIDKTRSQVALLNANKQAELDLEKSLDAQITEKTTTLDTVSMWLDTHKTDALLLEQFPEVATLKNLRLEISELQEKQKSFNQWSKKASSSLKTHSSTYEKDNKKIADLKRKLIDTEKHLESLMQGQSIEDLEELLKDQRGRVKSFQQLTSLALDNQKLSPQQSRFFGFLKSKPSAVYDIDAIQLKLDRLKKDLKLEENIKLALEESVFRNSLLKKMASDRKHLVDGKPCALCGATDHPYSIRPPEIGNPERALLDLKEKMQRLTSTIIKQEQLLTAAKKSADKSQSKNAHAIQLKSQWLSLTNRLNIAGRDMDITQISTMKQLLADETQELKNITSLVTDYHSTKNNIIGLKTLISKTESHLDKVHASTQTLDSDRQERLQALIEIDNALANCQKNEAILVNRLTLQLEALGEKLPIRDKEDLLIDRLNSRRQDYYSYVLRQKNLNDELHILSTKQHACQSEALMYDGQLQIYSKQLHAEEMVGLHLALVEKQKLIAETEQRISEQHEHAQQLQLTFKAKIQDSPFTTVHDVSEVLQLIEQQSDIEQHKAALDQLIAEKMLVLEKIKTQCLLDTSSLQVGHNVDTLVAALHSTTEQLHIAEMEAQRAENLLNEQENYTNKYNTLQAQLKSQHDATEQLLGEMALIDAENGMVFRRRVQNKMIEQLLSSTNAVLEKVSGRYYLRQKFGDQGLALEIEDTYQNNSRRLPKSLSGGESFIISLALALGLSELANNGKSIDSLFIDEGFGNLDAETLYTVISTLENLHAHQGKTVGVISHVESVQNRFKAQLQIVKKPNGMGMLKKAS